MILSGNYDIVAFSETWVATFHLLYLSYRATIYIEMIGPVEAEELRFTAETALKLVYRNRMNLLCIYESNFWDTEKSCK